MTVAAMTSRASRARTTGRGRDRTVMVEMTGPTHIDELANRESAGIQVSLFWSREDNTLSVVVRDSWTNEEFSLAAAPGEAMDVFRHPFAYAAARGVTSVLCADAEPVVSR